MLRQRHHAAWLAPVGHASTDLLRDGLHHRLEQRDARREDGRLRDRGVIEALRRACETDLGQLVAEHAVSFFKDGARDRGGLVHVAAHADGLRALPRENKCESGQEVSSVAAASPCVEQFLAIRYSATAVNSRTYVQRE